MRDVLSLIRSRGEEIDCLISTGDHTHDEQESSLRAVRGMLEPWLDRLVLVPGNHDDRSLIRQVFPDHVPRASGPLTFAVQVGGWRLIGLDSHIPGEVPGRIDPNQLDWLRGELADHCDQPTGLFLHHPPVPIGSIWMDAIRLQNGAELVDVVTQSPQVRFVSCGHLHYEYQSSIGQASFFTTPATSVQFDPAGTTATLSTQSPGYRIFELDADGFRTEVVRLPKGKYLPTLD